MKVQVTAHLIVGWAVPIDPTKGSMGFLEFFASTVTDHVDLLVELGQNATFVRLHYISKYQVCVVVSTLIRAGYVVASILGVA